MTFGRKKERLVVLLGLREKRIRRADCIEVFVEYNVRLG